MAASESVPSPASPSVVFVFGLISWRSAPDRKSRTRQRGIPEFPPSRVLISLSGPGSAIHPYIIDIHIGPAVRPGQIDGPAPAGGQIDEKVKRAHPGRFKRLVPANLNVVAIVDRIHFRDLA